MRQHTGNWPGKTVASARGEFAYNDHDYIMVDLPGTYSLFASSKDEEVSRDFLIYGNYEVVVVVADATCLERNLNLVFQICEITDRVILCINLIDEAKKKNITIDKARLQKELNIPVVLTAARDGVGMQELKNAIEKIILGKEMNKPILVTYDDKTEEKINEISHHLEKLNIKNKRWTSLRMMDSSEDIFIQDKENFISKKDAKFISEKLELSRSRAIMREKISEQNYNLASYLKKICIVEDKDKLSRDKKIDDIVTSKIYGIPIMLILLGFIFWLTIQGANVPSKLIGKLLFGFEEVLTKWFIQLNVNGFLKGLLVDGMYRTLAWIVSVMLPPMAIFFPLFSIFEDLGYLPRVAFNLDHLFKKACAHGKQSLCMCLGFGCNAAGVIGCRIIDSPRERMIAILTNNFVPCNGRFPTLITLVSIFFAVTNNSLLNSFISAFFVTIIVLVGILTTLLVSYILSKTLLRGIPSTFTLELPPYRVPKIGRLLYTSVIDRTIFVLSRAVAIAAPAGAVTWLLANIYVGETSLIIYISNILDPIANVIGLDGIILMSFIVGIPANEIVLPVMLMAYLSTGSLIELESLMHLREVLLSNGWTVLTALNVMLFSLLHWPCSTTLWTIKKETGSIKWTLLAFLISTVIAFLVCFITSTIYRLLI